MKITKIVILNSKKFKHFSVKFLETRFSLRNGTANNSNSTSNGTVSGNLTKSAPSFPSVVDKAPYKPVDCSQTVILKAKRLVNDYDYAVKKDAFFTLTPIRINIFDELNPNSLIKTTKMAGLDHHVEILKGSLNCLFFHAEENRRHNISMCIEDKNTTNQILEAYNFYSKCASKPSNLHSKIDALEKLLNTLNDPSQKEYKIPNFKRALAENLTGKGVNFIFNFLVSCCKFWFKRRKIQLQKRC